MKVGDLVVMPPQNRASSSGWRSGGSDATGIVVDMEPHGVKRIRVGVMWSDGDRIDWEPRDWLEVVNE